MSAKNNLALVAIGASLVVASKITRWIRRHKFIPREVEELTHGLGALVDDNEEAEDEEDNEVEVDGVFGDLFREAENTIYDGMARRNKTTRRKVRLVVKVAIELKVKFGSVADTAPNVLMMSDHARKFMSELGVRPTHITQSFPIAVRLALTPSAEDIMAAQMAGTVAVRSREALAKADWQPRPWFLPGGGHRVGLPSTGR